MAIPELRFKKEDGTEYPAWEEKKLGDLGSFIRGLSYDKNDVTDDKTKTLVLRSNNIIVGGVADCENGLQYVTKRPSPEQLLQKEDVIICLANGSDSLVGKTCSYNGNYSGPVTVGAFCGIYRCQSPIMHYLVQTENYRRKIIVIKQGGNGALANLYGNDILTLSFLMPSCLEEQQKIAAFLSDLDAVISASESEVVALEQQKKGAMQKIFSQEVRFRRDDGTEYLKWESGRIGDIIESYEEKVDTDSDLPILTSSKNYGIQFQSDHFGREQTHDIDGYNVLPRGYCTYRNRSDGVDFTFNINDICDVGIVSKFYPVFKDAGCDLYFLASFLNNSSTARRVIAYTAVGTGQRVLSFSDLKSITLALPCLEEQQKIADFLSSFDEAIALARQELEKWKLLKKGLMQQMFV